MHCIQCGEPICGVRCARCYPESTNQMSSANKGNAVTWPFHQPAWTMSLWMPLLGSFLWPFGMLITLGWSIEATGKLALQSPSPLPGVRSLARILKHGIVVVAAIFLYFIIPLFVISQVVEFSWLAEIWELVIAIWSGLTHTSHSSIVSSVLKLLLKLLANSTAPLVYIIFATPLFLAARLRYALTGQIRSFFNLTGNIAVCFRLIGEILLYLFLGAVTRAAIAFVLALAAGTVIGLLIPLALAGANTWILAFLAANVAKQMHERWGIGVSEMQGVPVAVISGRGVFAQKVTNSSPLPASPVPVVLQQRIKGSLALYCLQGPLKDKTFVVPKSGCFIGRSPAVSQIIIRLQEVSSQHVRVNADQSSDGAWVEDMNSTNGTYYRIGSGSWERLNGRVCLARGGRFRLSRGAAEFEVGMQ